MNAVIIIMENYNPTSAFLLDKWYSVKIINSVTFFYNSYVHVCLAEFLIRLSPN